MTTLKKKNNKKNSGASTSKTDWNRLRRMRRGQERIDTSDIPDAGETFWKNAGVGLFENKMSLSVRFDADLVRWFKSQGPKYQTRMNNVLRAYMSWKQQTSERQRASGVS